VVAFRGFRYANSDFGVFAQTELSRRRELGITDTNAMCPEAEQAAAAHVEHQYAQFDEIDDAFATCSYESSVTPMAAEVGRDFEDIEQKTLVSRMMSFFLLINLCPPDREFQRGRERGRFARNPGLGQRGVYE
jgi:hypothetical protein